MVVVVAYTLTGSCNFMMQCIIRVLNRERGGASLVNSTVTVYMHVCKLRPANSTFAIP